MGFTKICFIRKRTPELTEKLDKLGYRMGFIYSKEQTQIDSVLCVQGEFRFVQNSLIDIIKKDIPSVIDCGENEELFLAIAAIRDDTSDNQYWVFYEDFHKWKKGDFVIGRFGRCSCYCHVATVEELIEHFNNPHNQNKNE